MGTGPSPKAKRTTRRTVKSKRRKAGPWQPLLFIGAGLLVVVGLGLFGWSQWKESAGVEDLELKAKHGPLFAFQPVDPIVQTTMKNYEPDPEIFERLETRKSRGYTVCTLKGLTSTRYTAAPGALSGAIHRWKINDSQNTVKVETEDWPEPLNPTWKDVRKLETNIVEQLRKEMVELSATDVSMERCFVRGIPAYRTTLSSKTAGSGPGGTVIHYEFLTQHRVTLMGVCTEPGNSEECRLLNNILLTVHRPEADRSPLLAKPSSNESVGTDRVAPPVGTP